MIITAGFLVAGIAGIGLGLIVRELRKAPEGYEDEDGFHVIRKTAAGSKATKLRRTRAVNHPRTRPAIAH